MESCSECLRLETWLRRANEHSISGTIRQDRMIAEGHAEASTLARLEEAIRQTQGVLIPVESAWTVQEHTIGSRPRLTAPAPTKIGREEG